MRRLAALVLVLMVSSSSRAAVVTVSDGTFDPAGWQIAFHTFSSGGGPLAGGDVQASQIADGNSGTARRIAVILPPAPSSVDYASTFGAHLRVGFVYDPMTQGPIATIDYQEDARLVNGAQLTGLALRQGGELYFVQVEVFTQATWTHLERLGIVLTNFEHLTANGIVQGEYPDLTGSGGQIEVGFLRANSNGPGGSAFTVEGDIDNWRVRLNPPCALDAECDDGDACAAETCVAGACSSAPIACDDGDGCTTDACAAGVCSHTPLVCGDTDACTVDACAAGSCTHAPIDCGDADVCTADACAEGTCVHTAIGDPGVVEAKIDALLIIVQGSCAGEPLVKKFGKKLVKKLKKARAKVAAADTATRAALIDKLVDKSEALLTAADALLSSAAGKGLVSPACAAELQNLLDSLRACAASVSGP